MFFDRARIYVKAGDGGNGVVAFRREKFVPRGGPAGGNGGKGGDIVFEVDPGLNTLAPLHGQVHYRAVRGVHGSGANKTGARGADLVIPVPPGTVVRIARHTPRPVDDFEAELADDFASGSDADNAGNNDGDNHADNDTDAAQNPILADLVQPGHSVVIARGGRGGRGNAAFKTHKNTAPRMAEKGEAGEEYWLELELKLVADVGIIGVPNAGKSTLLSVVSAATPKIADYPFTTVVPNLGVALVNNPEHLPMVLADIPGLMEGAHEGVGLGLDFLRHIERTRVLIHVLNGDSPDPLGDYAAINLELELFNPELTTRAQIVAFNKMDLPHARERWPEVQTALTAAGVDALAISAVTHENVDQLLYRVRALLDALPPVQAPLADEFIDVEMPQDEKAFSIQQIEDGVWVVQGIHIERAAQMTNWDYYEAALRFQRILRAMGIAEALREGGIEEGDTVQIGEVELIWGYDNAFEE